MYKIEVTVTRRELEARRILIRRGELPSHTFADELQRYVYDTAWRRLIDTHGARLQSATIHAVQRDDYDEPGPHHSRWCFTFAITFAEQPGAQEVA